MLKFLLLVTPVAAMPGEVKPFFCAFSIFVSVKYHDFLDSCQEKFPHLKPGTPSINLSPSSPEPEQAETQRVVGIFCGTNTIITFNTIASSCSSSPFGLACD